MIKYLTLFIFIFPSLLLANNIVIHGTEEEILINKPKNEKGMIPSPYSTLDDTFRISLGYHVNANLRDSFSLTSFELLLGLRSKSFDGIWYSGYVAKTTSDFENLSENPSDTSPDNPQAESNNLRTGGEAQDLLTVGAGFGYRDRVLDQDIDFIQFNNLFQTISVYTTYNQLAEGLRGLDYSGYGFRALYGIDKIFAINYSLGLKLSYNFASVKQSSDINEDASGRDRELALSWLTLGVDLSIFF